MDRFEAMSMLVTVTETGSFSAASRTLQVPLATLSRKISDLEALLSVRLLVRTTRRLALTDAGIAYVAAARRILEQVEDAEREAAGEFTTPKGELVITAPIMFGRLHVLPIVAEFLSTFPEIQVRLLLADRNLRLIDDDVDMAVRIGTLANSTMVATHVGSMRMVTCASPALLAGHGRPKTPRDLLEMPCVVFDSPTPSPGWRYHPPGSRTDVDISIRPRLSVTTAEAAAEAAIRSVGVARLLHYQVAEAVERGALTIILRSFEAEAAPVHLIHVSRGQMPLKMRRFLDFATPRLRKALGQLDDPGAAPHRSG
jgi:DNA-binding transcriptional LysR family regulator